MAQDRRNASAWGGRAPAIGAFAAAVAVISGLAFVVLNSGGEPDPARPTPVGTAIVAPQGDEIAIAQTPTPPPTPAPAEAPTGEPPATATSDAGPTPTARSIKATRTPRPASPPTSTPLPNVKVTPSPTANATATARARATATARATSAATPVEVLQPVDSGSGVEPTIAPAAASGDLPVFEEPAAVPQEPVFQEPVYQEPAVDIFATVQAGQAAVRQPEQPVWESPVVVEIPEIAFPTPWNQWVGPGARIPPPLERAASDDRSDKGKPASTAKPSKDGKDAKSAKASKDRKKRGNGDGRPASNGRGG